MISKSKYAHGKLLLTGEYLVLKGARALALPLTVGQYLSWKKTKVPELVWNAMKPDGMWFQAKFELPQLDLMHATDEHLSAKLRKILQTARDLNPKFLDGTTGYEVQTILEFDPEFGFGSSSTLISNLAGWADVDAFKLAAKTFGGSGYDIACARQKHPIFYCLDGDKHIIEPATFDPPFRKNLLFVYLGHKQLTRESVAEFKKQEDVSLKDIERINRIGSEIENVNDLEHFESLIEEHEEVMSSILKMPRVKGLYFSDHKGAVKSLGAWGGDFVLMTFRDDLQSTAEYLEKKGFTVFFTYEELID